MFTQKSNYAVLFVLHLNQVGKATVKNAAEHLRLSVSFLEQVACHLRRAGIVSVKRGPGGGYTLVDANTTTIKDILAAVESNTQIEVDVGRAAGSEVDIFFNLLDNLNLNIESMLSRTITQVVRDETATSVGDALFKNVNLKTNTGANV